MLGFVAFRFENYDWLHMTVMVLNLCHLISNQHRHTYIHTLVFVLHFLNTYSTKFLIMCFIYLNLLVSRLIIQNLF